ncbi:hypothetical protein AcW1_009781 [Taiwanofungus camphoratus]|nr:hypothetical protein AcV5_002317 [Antrodia cinnamomea]KAI0941855.1 hypothetical protein AcV7_002424 [Antrodia cinnamomea]KAI0948203.1 hypothetical protein AcW1_009781 [Antrodia cinnamomea]
MAAAAIPIARPSSFVSADDLRRHSVVSTSAGSYLTASQTYPNSLSSSRSSSTHTLGPAASRESDNLASLHALALGHSPKASAQEVHIVKLTENGVSLQPGPVVGSGPDSNVGPPPPSPPSSTENDDGRALHAPLPSKSEPLRPVAFEDDARGSAAPREQRVFPRMSTASASSRASQSTLAPRVARTSAQSDGTMMLDTPPTEEAPLPMAQSTKSAPHSAHMSVDGYLQPPPVSSLKPSRRNTTGSSAPPAHASSSVSRMKTMHTPGPEHARSPSGEEEDGDAEGALASDIQQQAEQIRRERISKRAKAQQEAEKAKAEAVAERASLLTRTTSLMRGSSGRGDDRPLVGNLIGEGHVNYVLMYNMLTGIRIAVSRCQAKIRRPLTDEDYTARHKYSFDIVGNELTPSAKYDFKFKDYAPWVFRELREDYFHLDPADYLLSLTAKYILSELGSPGKSGSFFYFSRDYRFIIKTIHHEEHKFLRRILRSYHEHIKTNPHTLLSRFYGLHRVKLPRGRKIHFVIMNNLFPPHRDVHETFDLKGSTVGREYPEEKAQQNPRATLKDLNWINRGKTLEFGPEKRALLTEQIRRDSELLKKLYVMDYSLLVGIHNMQRGNKDNVRSNTLKVFSVSSPFFHYYLGTSDVDRICSPTCRSCGGNPHKAKGPHHLMRSHCVASCASRIRSAWARVQYDCPTRTQPASGNISCSTRMKVGCGRQTKPTRTWTRYITSASLTSSPRTQH